MAVILDNNDKTILKELQEDASITNLNLSKKIGLSPSACLARTKNLVETGIIQKYTAILDEKKLGIETLAFVLVNLSPLNRDTIKSFVDDINSFPQVQECYTLTGTHDYLLKIAAKDTQSYRNFIVDSLMQNTAVSGIETIIVLGTEKRTINMPIEEI